LRKFDVVKMPPKKSQKYDKMKASQSYILLYKCQLRAATYEYDLIVATVALSSEADTIICLLKFIYFYY
jgi:hypothetical protein